MLIRINQSGVSGGREAQRDGAAGDGFERSPRA
jgi:hypothetical protein